MIQRCLGFLLGLSSLYWFNSEEQVYIALSLVLFLLPIYWFVTLPLESHSKYQEGSIKQGFSDTYLVKSSNSGLAAQANYTEIFFKWCVLGILWASLTATNWLFQSSERIDHPQVAQVSGYVCNVPHAYKNPQPRLNPAQPAVKVKIKRVSFDFCVDQINRQAMNFWSSKNIKLTFYRPSQSMFDALKSGSYWNFEVKLKPIHGRLNPGGFDYEQWLVSNGYIATGYVKRADKQGDYRSINSLYHHARQKVFDKINAQAPNSAYKGLLLALAMGERKDISEQQWDALKNSGTAHLLAISGLHIGIAAIWSYYLVFWLCSRFSRLILFVPAQKIALWGALLAALVVALISGLGYPAQRALIMLLLFSYTRLQQRHLSLANLLALSVIIICISQPMAILTVSFWMSVMAVAVIVLILNFHRSTKRTEKGKHWRVTFLAWLKFNAYLFICLMPITWLVFDGVSLVGLIANLILIPLTSFVTAPLVYLASLSMLFSDNLSSILFLGADTLLHWSMLLQQWLSQINHLVALPSISQIQFMLLLLVAFLLLLPTFMLARKLLLPTLAVFLLSFLPSSTELKLKMLVFDIGQGLAVFIQVGNNNLLFDSGYGNRDYSMAKTSILPFLKRNKINHINKLIISHKDSDHSGGLMPLLESVEVKQLLVGETLKKRDQKQVAKFLPAKNCHEFKDWQWGSVNFSFINRQAKTYEKGNNQSCVLLIKTTQRAFLLTGDIEKAAETRLLSTDIAKLDLMIAPHHGSSTSSSPAFVELTQPKVIIFPTGFANQWHFPKTEIRARYRNLGATEYITHRDGAIEITLDNYDNIKIIAERQRRSHFWHRLPAD